MSQKVHSAMKIEFSSNQKEVGKSQPLILFIFNFFKAF